jgi:pilus assembly protein Flp/PilA
MCAKVAAIEASDGGRQMLRTFLRDQSGTTATEYGLIVALIAVGCIITLEAIGGNLSSVFMKVNSKLQ